MHCTRLTLRSWSGSDFYAQSNKRQNLLSHLDIFHVALIVDRSVSSPCWWFHFIFRDDWIKRVKRGGRGRSAWCMACLYTLYPASRQGLPWSLKMKRERTATPVAEFKSYLAFNHGFKEVATSFEIMKFSTKITMKQYDLFRTRDSGLGKYWKYLSSIIICIFKMICQVLE